MQRMDKPPSKSTAREVTEAAIVGGVGAVPVAGSPLAAAFALALGWSYNRRMTAWLEDLAEAVDELQQQGTATLEDLVDDDVFLDAVALATRAAQATHQQEKLEALRNAVLHSVGPDAPDVDEQARFFRYVADFTPSHLRLLLFLDDPGTFYDAAGVARPDVYMGGRSYLLDQLAEFSAGRDWYDMLHSDLTASGLTNGTLHAVQTGASLWQSATSALGKRFLAFVSAS